MNKLTRGMFLKLVFNYAEKQEWVYQGDLPCVIDFQDDTCPPCQAIAPIMRGFAETYAGRVRFYTVDTREEETLAQELGIKSLPTLVLCPLADRPVVIQGAADKNRIRAAIEKELLGEFDEEINQ